MTELHQHQEELRMLSSHIQQVQEEERGRIAREIHDALGQRLTSITMDIEFIKSKLGQDIPEEITDRLIALTNLTEETIKEKLPQNFQKSEYLIEKGMIDIVVHRRDLNQKILNILDFF